MSLLEKTIKTLKKIKKLFNFLITELVGDQIANNKELLDLINIIIKSDPSLVSDIKGYIFDTELGFMKTTMKIFNRVKQIDIINTINNLPEPEKIYTMLNNLHFKEIDVAIIPIKILKYSMTQFGGVNINVKKLKAASVAVSIILLIIGTITGFILEELQKKDEYKRNKKIKDTESMLEELQIKDEYERNKKIKDAETEQKIKSITSGGYNSGLVHHCY